jgi:quercetin dioxygenase-like cupin family protein
MKNQLFLFHSTPMKILVTTPETQGKYCMMEMQHKPGVGPAVHIHPRGNETFYVLEGNYTFWYGDKVAELSAGELLTVTPGVPHRYTSGNNGGRLLIVMPPDLENYFWEVAGVGRMLDFGEERQIAEKYGQDFLDHPGQSPHW